MGRIRYVKPDFFKDEDLVALSPYHRLCYEGLWTQADRSGRMRYRPKRLKLEIFPYEDLNFEGLIADLETAKFVRCYVVGGVKYLDVPSLPKHQRFRCDEPVSVLPRWEDRDQDPLVPQTVPVAVSVTVPCALEKVPHKDMENGERRMENGGTYRAKAEDMDRLFCALYAAYPNKDRKNPALASFHALMATTEDQMALAQRILDAVTLKLKYGWVKRERHMIPQLATFLDERQFDDVLGPVASPAATEVLYDCRRCGKTHKGPDPTVCLRELGDLYDCRVCGETHQGHDPSVCQKSKAAVA